MGKRVLSKAELEQRRAAAKNGGRPRKPTSDREVLRAARARLGIERARAKIKTVQEEVVDTLIQGMRGLLPQSTASSMIDAARSLATKGGLPDQSVQKNIGDPSSQQPIVAKFQVDLSGYPKPAPRKDDGDDDGSAVAN